MNYYLLIYVLLCIVIELTMTVFLAQTGRGIGAIVFLIGAIMVFLFFGLRWFDYGINPLAGKSWPPIINTCPDYLVYVERMKGTQKIGSCVDPLGVSTGPLQRWVYSGDMSGSGVPSSDNMYFDLDFGITDPVKLLAAQCQRCQDKGVTWEGVFNGDSCYTQNALAAAAAAGVSQCASAAPAATPVRP